VCASRAERLIVFTRYPEAGTTKTRLIPALGAQGAADLQRDMTERTVAEARRLAESRRVALEVRFEGGSAGQMAAWLGDDLRCLPQGTGDLGDRMERAVRQTLDRGARRAVIVGTDCPDLTADTLADAFDALADHDLVLGPAADGGYYLIGLRQDAPALFEDIPWGTSEVLRRTLSQADELGLRVQLLDELADVDRPDDLHRLRSETISVIIPALDEARHIATAIASARATGAEIIVADGGSTDGTPAVARNAGAAVLDTPPGKARQMNAGAEAASGDILLFLHADTRLPDDYARHVREALAGPEVVAGAFAFRADAPLRRLRAIEWLANFRSRRLHMPYGDQGIFLRAATFRELGGFPDQPIMEDFELVRRLKRRGRIVHVPLPAATSARRWLHLGVLRTTVTNQLAIAAYLCGVSPHRIARWYQRQRGKGKGRPTTDRGPAQ
jgi:hypothetical protein